MENKEKQRILGNAKTETFNILVTKTDDILLLLSSYLSMFNRKTMKIFIIGYTRYNEFY